MNLIQRLNAQRKRHADAVASMKAITEAAGAADLTAEQTAAFEAAKAEAEAAKGSIAQVEALIEAERSVVLPDNSRIENLGANLQNDPARGFAHFGSYLEAVRGASLRPHALDDRLRIDAAAPSTYANESSGADGGFLVPPTFATEIMSVIDASTSLYEMVRKIPISGTEWKYPANETTAWGSTGVVSYWDSEASVIQQSKPAFKNGSIKLDRLTTLCPVTEESLEDAPALGAWVNMEAGEKMGFKLDDSIYNGTGDGMPLGILNAPCLVTVSKETSQPANTLMAENVLKMFSRMPVRFRTRAVWVINQDLEPLLPQMNIKVKNVAGSENVGGLQVPPVVYTQPGANGAVNATLMGRPVLIHESASAVSALGDIALVDFNQYIAITKGAVKADQSMHFWFDQNLRAFRFVLRVGGQPWLSAPIGRKNGSNTLSCAVTLQAR